MKWTLYVEPNHCFDEEFPTGWSHDAVMKAAQARYAGKVSTVAPAAIGGSDDDDEPRSSRSSSYSSSSWGESLGTFGVLVGFFGIIAFWEVIVTLIIVGAIGSTGFLGLGAYLNWKEEQDKIKAKEEAEKNRPAQVSHKYRTEAFN